MSLNTYHVLLCPRDTCDPVYLDVVNACNVREAVELAQQDFRSDYGGQTPTQTLAVFQGQCQCVGLNDTLFSEDKRT